MCDVDSYELLVCTVRYCILVLVEVLDKGISLVCDVFRSEPTKVVAVGDDEYGLTILNSLRSHGVLIYPVSITHLSNSIEKF